MFGPMMGLQRWGEGPNMEVLRRNADAADARELASVQRNEQQRQNAFMQNPTNLHNIVSMGGPDKVMRERLNQGQNKMSPWRLYFQALKDKGVNKLQTGAAAGMDAPGFFDQAPMGALMQQRMNYLDASDANQQAGSYQDFRRMR